MVGEYGHFQILEGGSRCWYGIVGHDYIYICLRFWSNDPDLSHRFNFTKSDRASLPLDAAFWDFFFSRAKSWGVKVFEQDWLNRQIQ